MGRDLCVKRTGPRTSMDIGCMEHSAPRKRRVSPTRPTQALESGAARNFSFTTTRKLGSSHVDEKM
jgi:hypothetical protein